MMSGSQPTPERKPQAAPPPGSEDCGCCDGIAAAPGRAIANRGGLSAIGYRIGDYAQFRATMHAALSSSEYAPLARLRTRDPDDFTIGLIDALACSADVLTFYQERIANESYLRTAREPVSLQEMGKLIGYRLRPGLAAETWLAFAVETPPPPPPGLPAEPGNFVTGVPPTVALEAGLKVQSVPGPGEQPQAFETLEPLAEARPAWNGMRPWLADRVKPGNKDTFAYLQGVRNNLRAGDALVFLGDEYLANTNSNRWDFRILDSVELQPASDRTLVRWKRPLGSVSPFTSPAQDPQVHVLRKRAAGFGHNAPMWGSMSTSFRNNYPGSHKPDKSLLDQWPYFTLTPVEGNYIDLDAPLPEAGVGSYVVLAKGGFNYASAPPPAGTYVELYKVTNAAEVSRAEFAIAAKLTRLQLDGANYATQFRPYVRETAVFAASERLELAEYPVDTAIKGSMIPVAASADGLLPGRRLLVRGIREADGVTITVQATLLAAHPAGQGRCQLELALPLPAALVRASVVVYANVAPASHGETVAEVLGSGSAATAFQRFELKHQPLTWLAAANELGAAAALTVRVNDVAWRELPTLFGAAPTQRAFVLERDERGRMIAVFGDGVRGARLPSGVNNVRATYRKGLGAQGNVGPDKLTQLMSRPLGLKSVSNPLPATGGNDPEPVEAARASMPLATRTLGRAVSLLDYEDFARAFSGIAKARAQVLRLATGPVVAITIAGQHGAPLGPASPEWQHLLAALKNGGDPHVAVRLLAAKASSFRIGIKVKCAADREAALVLAAVEAALRDRYSFERRELSQPVQQSEVIAVAQAVPGVVAVDLTHLYGGTAPYAQTLPSVQARLLAAQMQMLGGVIQPAELLTLAPGPFDLLEEMP
jgi:hypothetical protein